MTAVYARRLNSTDLDELYRVFDTRSTVMKVTLTDENRRQHKEDARKHIESQNNLIVYWGAFDQSHKLCSYLVQEFSKLYPRWYLKVLVTEDTYSLKPFRMRSSGLGLCIDRAIAAAESLAYFEWLYAVVPDRFGTRAKIWTTQSESVSRYMFVVDSAFRENDVPKFSYQRTLIPKTTVRNKTWIIKKAVLKPEYRFDILNNQGKLDLTYKDAYNE
jgi:hypothetical protein